MDISTLIPAATGRPTSDATKVAKAVLVLCAAGSPVQAAMLAACILVVADQNTPDERVDETAHADNGVGFSKRTARTGLRVAKWVRGGHSKTGEKYPAKPISDGYWLGKAHEVVSFHAKQVGRLQVSIGALDVAMQEIEESHGVVGLQEAFREAMFMQERVVVERIAPAKPAKVKLAKAGKARSCMGSAPQPVRWGGCS